MIDGERRGHDAAYEQVAPVLSEMATSETKLKMPGDQALGEMAATAWIEYQSRGYAHIEPREAFLRGYAVAVRHMLNVFNVLEQEGAI